MFFPPSLLSIQTRLLSMTTLTLASNKEDEETCKHAVKAVERNICSVPSNLVIYLTVPPTKQTKKCVLERIDGRMGSKFVWRKNQIINCI